MAYVAITRAKKKLVLTCNSGYSYTTDSRATPSVFFSEAGITFPEENPYRKYSYDGGYNKGGYRKSGNGWRTVSFGNRNKSFFSDGDAIDPFEPSEPKEEPDKPKDNGIHDWCIGDHIRHEKFGLGVVTEIIDESIIVVTFENGTKKTLLSSHPMITRIAKPGAEA